MDAAMKLKPDLRLSVATAQAIVGQVAPKQLVAAIRRLHGGEIAAVYEIAFVDEAHPPLVLKVYPDELHWKMQKEVTVLGLIQDRLSVSVPRILVADDSKRLLDLNFILMTRLDGSILVCRRCNDWRLTHKSAGCFASFTASRWARSAISVRRVS
jgi:hypothetical protein